MTDTLTTATEAPTTGRTRLLDLVGLVARLVLGGVLLYAGATKVLTPSEEVGPGSTLLTVTFVPASVSARPRATDSCAVLVMP